GAIAVDVGKRIEALLKETEELGAGLALGEGVARADRTRPEREGDLGGADGEEKRAESSLLTGSEDEDAHEQYGVTRDEDDEAREEVGERGNVAVDALDQLAWGAAVVEEKVQPQAVRGQVGAERVGGAPADVGRDVRFGQPDYLGQQGDAEVGQRRHDECR